jgi:hypothetical protein
MQIKIDSGWIGAAVTLAATGACVRWPEASNVIGPVLFGIAALVFIFGVRIEGLHLRWIRRRRMVPLLGMVIFGAGFLGCAVWYFWPVSVTTSTDQRNTAIVSSPSPVVAPHECSNACARNADSCAGDRSIARAGHICLAFHAVASRYPRTRH